MSSIENPDVVLSASGQPDASMNSPTPVPSLGLSALEDGEDAQRCCRHEFAISRARRILWFNLGWSGANQSIRAATFALFTVLAARHLGPSAYGAFSLSLAIVKIAAVVAGFGLDRVVVRELVLNPNAFVGILRRSLLFRLGSGVVMYLVTCVCVSVFLPDDHIVLILVAIAGVSILLQAFDTFDSLFQARGCMKLSFFGRTIPVVAAAVLKVAAVLLGATAMAFAALEALEAMLISVGLVTAFFMAAKLKPENWMERPQGGPFRMARDAFPLAIAAVAIIVYARSDVIMLGAMVGNAAAGVYVAASQISELWAILPLAIAPAVYPTLIKLRETNQEEYEKRFELLIQGMIAIAYLIAIGVTVLAPLLVGLLYGEAYTEAIGILTVHVWSVLFVFLGTAQCLWDAGERMFWLTCIRTVLGAATNIALNLVLIPRYGALGAAIATVISYSIAGFLLNAIGRTTRPLFAMQLRSLCLIPMINFLRNQIAGAKRPERRMESI